MRHIIHKILKEEGEKKPNIFVPHNVEGRKELRTQQILNQLNRKVINGDLDLSEVEITDLGDIEEVKGNLSLTNNKFLISLGKLKRVDGYLSLHGVKNVDTLGNLEYVGNWLDLDYSGIKDLGNLKEVGWNLYVRGNFFKSFTDHELRKLTRIKGGIIRYN
jgi:hypothetical protein